MPALPEAMEVACLDELSPSKATDALLSCCASCRWAADLVQGRPYGSLAGLTDGSDAALAALRWADIEQALGAHPRIGARPGETGGAGETGAAALSQREASWSAQEQRSTAALDAAALGRLRAANAEYEQRFGHVFLICATGKSAAQMLDALHERLGHDAGAEREVVRAELRDIVALRLGRAFR